jgi:hypothetical protein
LNHFANRRKLQHVERTHRAKQHFKKEWNKKEKPMSMSNAIPGNQKLAQASWLPVAILKSASLGPRLADLVRRLSELLRTTKTSDGREDDTMYFGM